MEQAVIGEPHHVATIPVARLKERPGFERDVAKSEELEAGLDFIPNEDKRLGERLGLDNRRMAVILGFGLWSFLRGRICGLRRRSLAVRDPK